MVRCLAVTALLTLLAAPVLSAPPDDTRAQMREAERRTAEQRAARQDASNRASRAAQQALALAHARAEAAAKLREAEARTGAAAREIDALAARRREAERRLRERAEALQPLLPLIERLSLYPTETLFAVPVPAEAAVRGIVVLRGLARQIEIEAEALRRDQADLDAATEALRREAPKLAEAAAAQRKEEDLLDREIAAAHAARSAAEADATKAATQAAAAANRAETLRAALLALEAERKAQEAKAREDAARAERQKRTEEAKAAKEREAAVARPTGPGSISAGAGPKGQLQPPVIGVVIKAWGANADGGPASGISYQAPPGARVVSPCGGRVVFADTFRSYGLLVIVDCGSGYHVVLAGLEKLDIHLGQTIVAGEPVGTMASWQPGSEARRPALYVELRHDGQAIDPAPWLRSNG
jgi:hypothetical protein